MPSLRDLLPPLLVFGLTAGAASAEVSEVAWDASGRSERSFEVAPTKFAEFCTPLRRGEAIRWAFDADQPLDFNIHYHVGQDVTYPTRQAGASRLDGRLAVEIDQHYCWMWTNRGGAPARATLKLQRE